MRAPSWDTELRGEITQPPGTGPRGSLLQLGASTWGPLRLGWRVPPARRARLAAAGVAPGQLSDLDVRLWGATPPAKSGKSIRTLLLAVVRGRGVSLCPPHHVADPGPSWVCAECLHSRGPQVHARGSSASTPHFACAGRAGKALACTPQSYTNPERHRHAAERPCSATPQACLSQRRGTWRALAPDARETEAWEFMG